MTNPRFSQLSDFAIACFSHLRWGFVYQRPQHLLSRFAKQTAVYYFEEPVYYDGPDMLQVVKQDNVTVLTPHIQHGTDTVTTEKILTRLVAEFLHSVPRYCTWYYTPMALPFTRELAPIAVVYDCMDELSAFKFAPAALKELEVELLDKADVVFTGGYSIYNAKKHSHPNIHPFPSSIDKEHFGQARLTTQEPPDQEPIPHPRLGFFGVIDERFDVDLIASVAQIRPDWHFVLIGPVVKIDPATLPRNPNIYYLGGKQYQELPTYLAGWDIALIPFARNESTQFISPTKTPEYLAGGKPVISTAIADVVDPYGKHELVYIVNNTAEFIRATELELSVEDKSKWLQKVDTFLQDYSWDHTWQQMVLLIAAAIEKNNITTHKNELFYV